MTKPIAKSKRPQAERAAEHMLRKAYGCVITRRAVRTQWARVDFWGADVVGKTATGAHVYCQATAGSYSALSARRKKLEAIPWHRSDTVLLVQLIERESPQGHGRKEWFFRMWEYALLPGAIPSSAVRTWQERGPLPVRREWFRAWREADARA